MIILCVQLYHVQFSIRFTYFLFFFLNYLLYSSEGFRINFYFEPKSFSGDWGIRGKLGNLRFSRRFWGEAGRSVLLRRVLMWRFGKRREMKLCENLGKFVVRRSFLRNCRDSGRSRDKFILSAGISPGREQSKAAPQPRVLTPRRIRRRGRAPEISGAINSERKGKTGRRGDGKSCIE